MSDFDPKAAAKEMRVRNARERGKRLIMHLELPWEKPPQRDFENKLRDLLVDALCVAETEKFKIDLDALTKSAKAVYETEFR